MCRCLRHALPLMLAARCATLGGLASVLADAPTWKIVAPARAARTAPVWQVLATSVERRPLEFAQWGEGDRPLLLLGPLAGDRTEGLKVVDELVARLRGAPLEPGVRIVVLRDPNPDGRAHGLRTNARGVDLDRNFPTADWHKMPHAGRWASGRVPQSEPETRALVRFLQQTRPCCVIFIATGIRRPSVGYLGSGEPLARAAAEAGSLPLWPFDAARHWGSCPAYAGNELALPVVLLMCAPHVSPDENWQALEKPLMALLRYEARAAPPRGGIAEAESPQHVREHTIVAGTCMGVGAADRAHGGEDDETATMARSTLQLAAAPSGGVPAQAATLGNNGVLPGQARDRAVALAAQELVSGQGDEHVRYLLPFTAAARRARHLRLAGLYERQSVRDAGAGGADASAEEDGTLVPVVSPRAAREKVGESREPAATRGGAAGSPAIERLPPLAPLTAEDRLRSARPWRDSRGLPRAYPATQWAE